MEWARLVGWKLLVHGRHSLERRGGSDRLRARGESWGREWAERWEERGGARGWLGRPGAGRFWIPAEEAERWASSTCTPEDRAIADLAVRNRVDLLGTGPVDLGAPPRWCRDLYSGYEWPLVASDRLPIVREDGSDIRTVWELSRGYHFVALARARASTGEARFRDTFVEHASSWMEQNPLGRGPHWASPMDVAIRSANWSLALLLFAHDGGIPSAFWGRYLGNLLASGFFLERHLEWHPVYRGNHFVSNGVGLLYLGVLFRGSPHGERWMRRGVRILTAEMRRQVGDDGVSFESSLAYHRLVTEFFGFGAELMRLNLPGGVPAGYEERLRRMYGFIAAYLPASGEAPMVGDADDGRLHALSAEGFLHPRRHRLGLPERYWPTRPPEAAPFPDGGFFVLRTAGNHALIRCGSVGIEGAGSHDHNDQLSLELVLGGRRVLADSGTYAYTRDLAARHAFRSTAAHGVVQLGDEEQNPIRVDRPWRVLADRARARCTRWEIGPGSQRFQGRHLGFAHRDSGAVCQRDVVLEPGRCEIVDHVSGAGRERFAWRLHFGEGELEPLGQREDGFHFRLAGTPSIRLRVRPPAGLSPAIATSPGSDRYGERHERPSLVIRGEVPLPATVETLLWMETR